MKPLDTMVLLKNKQLKKTAVRSDLLAILSEKKAPCDAMELLIKLRKKYGRLNKTTVYRQLQTLTYKKILKTIELGEGKKRYELKTDHHHHLICRKCKNIKDVRLKNDLSREESIITEKYRFRVIEHSLEFFGICRNCS